MAIQRVGNSNVYIIETNVPEPTDSRGRGYGFLVSDQRWRVWDEISKMTAADMRAAGAADDDIVKAQAQQQRLLQSQISDLVRQKNSLIAGAVTKDATVKAKAASGSNVEVTTYKETTKEVIDSFGDKVTLKVPERVVIKSKGGQAPAPEASATETPTAGVRAAIQPNVEEIDKLIGERVAELDKLKSTPVGTSAPQQDLMTQVQQRYAAQMGYGGFGLPKSAKPAVDYSTAAGDINALLQNAEDDAAMKYRSDLQSKGIAEGLPEVEAQVRADARAKTIEDIYTSVVPKPGAELPVEGPRFGPRGGVVGRKPITDKEIEEFNLSRGGPITGEPPVPRDRGPVEVPKVPFEYEDEETITDEAPRTGGSGFPGFDERAAIFEMLGVPLPNISAPSSVVRSRPLMPFSSPTVARLPAQVPESFQSGPYKTSVDIGNKTYGEIPGYQYEAPIREALRSGPSPLVTQPPLPVPAQLAPNELAQPPVDIRTPTKTAPLRKPLDTKAIDEELNETGAKMSVPARRDAYALAVVEGGARLAAQPKKFERLAKTNLPQNERAAVVPQFITIVDKLYDVNAGKATAFKSTYDEISRFYANAPDTRKAAHEYLTAKDILATNTTKPV
jgi:hypothetical protein